ncbi:MAG: MFS transporter [Sporichthyaceae bacterium]
MSTNPPSSPPPPPREPGRSGPGGAAAWREAARTTARAGVRAGSATRRTVRRATNAQGAGESGMSKLTELCGVNSAADALVTVALAGSLFFSVPIGEARGRVALYLIVTMVPFALLAPLIGPLLDKFRSGRRYAIATTFFVRAFLAWSIVGTISNAGLWLYPAVFGILASSKAFAVTKSACVPRLLPPSVPLVRANSWTNMAGLLAAAAAAGVGALVTKVVGVEWTLRGAAAMFVVGGILSLRLPKRVDSAVAEQPASLSDTQTIGLRRGEVAGPSAGYVGPSVALGLKANMAFRAVAGFLTLFLAFLLRQDPISGVSDTMALGLVLGAAGIGSVVGTAVGAAMKQRAPEIVVVLLLVVLATVLLLAAVGYGLVTVLAAGAGTGFAQTLGKLALDAMIQRDVAEENTASAFARSETRLQLAWVAGGALGIGLPLRGDVGFGIAAGAMITLTAIVLGQARENRRARSNRARQAAASRPAAEPAFEVPDPAPAPDPTPAPAAAPEPADIPFPPLAAQHRDHHQDRFH